jgi:tetratricopeptide (TPR) repeat protein/WD40 repeat protein
MTTSSEIRAALEGMSSLDRQLVDPARWARDAGEIDDEILAVFTAPAFLELRMNESGGVTNLLDDFGILAEAKGEEFRLVGNALRLSANILARDPGQLATQLLARLPTREKGSLADLRTNLAAEYPQAFQPVRTTLTTAAQAFLVRQISDAGLTAMACAPDGELAALDAQGRVHFILLSENRFDVVATLMCARALALAFTPTGKRLLVGAQDGTLTIIDASSRTKVQERRLQREIHSLVCLDEVRVAIVHEEGASVMSCTDGRELARVGYEEGADSFTAIAAEPGGEFVYTGGFEGRIDKWRADDGRFVGRVGWFGEFSEGRTSRAIAMVQALTRSKSFTTIDGTVERLDFEAMLDKTPNVTPELRESMRRQLRDDPHRNTVTVIFPVDDCRTVIAGSISGEVRVWDTSVGTQAGSLEGHGRGIRSLTLNGDHERLISTGDGKVRVWNINRMVSLGELPTRAGTPEVVCCTPDGKTAIAACDDGSLIAWDLAFVLQPSAPGTKNNPLVELGRPPGQERAWAITRSGSVQELSTDTGSRIRTIELPIGSGKQARLSPEGRRLAVVVMAGLYVVDVETTLPMYHVPFTSSSESDEIQALAVSDDGCRVVIARTAELMAALISQEGQVELFEMPTGERVTLKTSAGLADGLKITPDGHFATFQSRGRSGDASCIEVWDLDRREKVTQQVIEPGLRAGAFAFHPDRTSLLWSEERSIRRLRIGTDQLPEDVLTTSGTWQRLAVSGGGGYAALFDGTKLELWDFVSRVRLAGFEADRDLTSCRVMPELDTVMALDKEGGITILRFRFPRGEPAQASEARSDVLAFDIDSIAALERAGRGGQAVEFWIRLAERSNLPSVFLTGLARLLKQTGRSVEAETILCSVIEKTKGEERRLAFDLLLGLGTPLGISKVLRSGLGATVGDREAVVQLSEAAEWLAKRKERALLESIADTAATGPARLIAAQVLDQIDKGAASKALRRFFDDRSVNVDLRAVAWISLRSIMSVEDWLKQTCSVFVDEPWPVSALDRIGHEILRTLGLGVALQGLLPSGDDGLPAVAPLRTVTELNQEAIGLGEKGQYDEAIEIVDQAIRHRPQGARYYHTRAALRLGAARTRRDGRQFPGHIDPAQELFELASQDLTKAIELDPAHESAWSQRGYARLELGRYELALPDIAEAIRLGGSDPVDFRNRAFCLDQLGRHREAEQDRAHAEVRESHRKKAPPGESLPTVTGRTRAGDEPTSTSSDFTALAPGARLALERLGLAQHMRAKLAGLIRNELVPPALLWETMGALALLDGRRDIEAIATDETGEVAGRVVALKQLVSSTSDDSTLRMLAEIATNTSHPAEWRLEAACTVAENSSVETAAALLRRLGDVDQTQTPPPPGTLIAPHVFRSMRGRPGAGEQIAALARDVRLPAPLREIACEVVGTYFDKAEGGKLLRILAAEISPSDPLHGFIDRAVAAFAGDDAREAGANLNPAQAAFDAFNAARSPEDIARLARMHRVFFDPEFVAQTASFLPGVPSDERALYEAKLAQLNALPPDHEAIGFRMFARAGSLEEMKAAVLRYPFLADPDYYPKIVQIIEESTDVDSRPAFERRLAWLRTIPPDPWQGAQQAFVDAETDEQLKDAVARHPALTRQAFPQLARKALEDSPDWPSLARRLEKLSTLATSDTDELIEAGARALATGEPEQALQFLDRVDEQTDEQVRWLRALALVVTGGEEEAIELLNDLISQAPDALAYAARGRAFCNLRRFREARADFTEALAQVPDNYEARLGRGLANANLGLHKEAVEDLTLAESVNPAEAIIYPLRGAALLAEGRAEEALRDFTRAVELFPGEASIRMTLSQILADLGREDEAEAILRGAGWHAPGDDAADMKPLTSSGNDETSDDDPDRAFQALMAARSTGDLEDAVKRTPLLSNPEFIEYLERQCEQQLEGNAVRALRERLVDLRRIVFNPPQVAFDALMQARSEHELRLARDQYALLRDAAFLEHLGKIAHTVEPAAAREHLTSCVATLKGSLRSDSN